MSPAKSSWEASAARIRLLILDVDGVLTDGSLYYGANGESLKRFHVHDGQGIKSLQKSGIQVAVISGRDSPMVAARMRELGVDEVFQGDDHKLPVAESMLQRLNLRWEDLAAMGDDVSDLPLLQRALLAIAPANAHASVQEIAHLTTVRCGGDGAVREACDALLRVRSVAGVRAGRSA